MNDSEKILYTAQLIINNLTEMLVNPDSAELILEPIVYEQLSKLHGTRTAMFNFIREHSYQFSLFGLKPDDAYFPDLWFDNKKIEIIDFK